MSASKKVYLFANWKMYLDLEESHSLSKLIKKQAKKMSKNIKMVVFPSALSFSSVAQTFSAVGIDLGSQNIHSEDRGGFTGEVSALMYKKSGAKYALVGHSERRHLFHETNHDVRQKMEAAIAVGLVPVLCVGETAQERENGKTEETIEIQIRSALHMLNWNKNKKLIIAYEPVWAISKGTSQQEAGKHCDYFEAQRLHKFIKKLVSQLSKSIELTVLFGGSVRPNTVKEYLNQPDIDGVLVGAASTKLDSWLEIVHNAC